MKSSKIKNDDNAGRFFSESILLEKNKRLPAMLIECIVLLISISDELSGPKLSEQNPN